MTTPDAPPPQPAQGGSSTPWIIALAVVLIIAAAVGFYFIGKNAADTSTKESAAASRVRAEYQPGQPAYQAIYAKGKARGVVVGTARGQKAGQAAGEQQGKQLGLEQGTAAGQAQGDATGVKNGANAALGGYPNWDTGTLYIVNMDPGTGNVPFVINSRHVMTPGNNYRICQGTTDQLCAVALPSGSAP